MSRTVHKLQTKSLEKSVKEGDRKTLFDGGNLAVKITGPGRASYTFRYQFNGKQRNMGIGDFHSIGLKEARDIAAEHRKQLALGNDPMIIRDEAARLAEEERQRIAAEREEAERAERARQSNTFAVVAQSAFDSKKAELKDPLKWWSPVKIHLLEGKHNIADTPITDIDQHMIKSLLQPMWHPTAKSGTKNDRAKIRAGGAPTAKKLLDRFSVILKHGFDLGHDVNPLIVASARRLLGKSTHKVENIPSLDWQIVPQFYEYVKQGGATPRNLCLRFLMLSGMRSGPVRHLCEEWIDEEKAIITFPAEIMKIEKSHVLPLTNEMRHIIDLARQHTANDKYLWPNVNASSPISDATMSKFMRCITVEDHPHGESFANARPHGFRSTIKVWILENFPELPDSVHKHVLSHAVGDQVERAYARTSLLELRRKVMNSYSAYLATGKMPVKD